jgi:hypothetical protein
MFSRGRTVGRSLWPAVIVASLSLFAAPAACAQVFVQLFINYHSQIPAGDPSLPPNWPFGEPNNPAMPNGFCTVACIDMLFNYWNDPAVHQLVPTVQLPQKEIAAVANTNDPRGGGGWVGTQADDARRAVHFSSQTALWPNAPPDYLIGGVGAPRGYSWRPTGTRGVRYGYVGIDGDWGAQHWTMAQLKAVLVAHVPLIVHLDPDSVLAYAEVDSLDSDRDYDLPGRTCQPTAVGHSVVLNGYDDGPRNVFLFKDPTRGPAWMMNQQKFWNAAWASKKFFYVAPWGTAVAVPPLTALAPWGFVTTGTASYADQLPVAGTGVHVQTSGQLTFLGPNPVAALAVGQQAQIGFANVVTSGQQQNNTWNCVVLKVGNSTAEVETWGVLQNAQCTTFPGGYNDDIGAIATTQVTVNPALVTYDPSICMLPRPWGWWHGPHIFPQPWNFTAGTPILLTAEVANRGANLATGVLLRWFWGDPALAAYYPDTNWHTIATTTLPPIPPGGDIKSAPVTWLVPTGNGLGQPYYALFAVVEGSGDPQHDMWVETDNNLACRSYNRIQTAPGTPVTLRFWAYNPESTPAWVVTRLWTDKPPAWSASLGPAGSDSVLLASHARVARTLTVNPNTPWQSTFDVYEYVYDTTGHFVRCTGGTAFFVSTAPVDVGPGGDPPAVTLAVPLVAGSQPVDLSFRLARASDNVNLSLFDVRGARIAALYRGAAPAGTTHVQWTATNEHGTRVASGVYIVRLAAGKEAVARKLMVLR